MQFVVTAIKTKNGNLTPVLIVKMGYRNAYLSFDKALISELAQLPISALYDIKEGEEMIVGKGVK